MSTDNAILEKVQNEFAYTVEQKGMITSCTKDVLVYFSAGKDSSALVDLLLDFRKKRDLNYRVKGVMLQFPQHSVKAGGIERVLGYWKERNVDIDLIGSEIPDEVLDNKEHANPCYTCIKKKGEIMMPYVKSKYRSLTDLTIVTGHHLVDTNDYLIELLLLKECDDIPRYDVEERRILLGWRIYPMLDFRSQDGPLVVRPLMNIHPDDITKYVQHLEIPLGEGDIGCKHLAKSPKRFYFMFMEFAGTRGLSQNRVMEIAEQLDVLPRPEEWISQPRERMFY